MSEYAHRSSPSFQSFQQSNKQSSSSQQNLDWSQHPFFAQKKSKFLPINKPTGDIKTGLKILIDADGDQKDHELELVFKQHKGNVIEVVATHQTSQENETFDFTAQVPSDQFYIWHQEVSDGCTPYKLYLNVDSSKELHMDLGKGVPKDILKSYKKAHASDLFDLPNADKTGYESPLTMAPMEGDEVLQVRPEVSPNHQTLTYHFMHKNIQGAPTLQVPYAGALADNSKGLVRLDEKKIAEQKKTAETTKKPSRSQTLSSFTIPIQVGAFGDEYILTIMPSANPGWGKLWIDSIIEGHELKATAPMNMKLPWVSGKKTNYRVVTYPEHLEIFFGESTSGKANISIYQQHQTKKEEKTDNGVVADERTIVLNVYTYREEPYRIPATFKGGNWLDKRTLPEKSLDEDNFKDHAWKDARQMVDKYSVAPSIPQDIETLFLQDEAYIEEVLTTKHSYNFGNVIQPVDLWNAYARLRKGIHGLLAYQKVLRGLDKESDIPPSIREKLVATREATKQFKKVANSFRAYYPLNITAPLAALQNWSKANYKSIWVSLHLKLLKAAQYIKGNYIARDSNLNEKQKKAAHQANATRGTLRKKLLMIKDEVPARTFKVPTVFYPEQGNFSKFEPKKSKKITEALQSVNVPVYVYRQGYTWYIRSFLNHKQEGPFKADYTLKPDERTEEFMKYPPAALMEKLGHKDHLPKGWLFYEIPGRPFKNAPIQTKAEWEFEDYAAWVSVALLAAGITMASWGTTAPVTASVGSALLWSAGVAGAAGAVAKTYRKYHNNTATSKDYLFGSLDLIGAFLGTAQFSRFGQALNKAHNATTLASQLKPLNGSIRYMTIKTADLANDATMVLAGGVDAWYQIEQVLDSDASAAEKNQQLKVIIGAFLVQKVMFLASVHPRVQDIRKALSGQLATVKNPKLTEVSAKDTPELAAFRSKGHLDARTVDAYSTQVGGEALEAAMAKIQHIKAEEWEALKALYPEMDVLRALHFYGGDVAKARAYLRKHHGYTDVEEQTHFRNLTRGVHLNGSLIKGTRKSIHTEQKRVENQEHESALYDMQHVYPTRSQHSQNSAELKNAQVAEKRMATRKEEIEQTQCNNRRQEDVLIGTQKAYVEQGVRPEKIPQEDDLAKLEKALAAVEPRYQKQAEALEMQKSNLETSIQDDALALNKLEDEFDKIKKDTTEKIKDIKQKVQDEKGKYIDEAFKKQKGHISEKSIKKIQKEANEKFLEQEQQAAKQVKAHEKSIADQKKILEEFAQELERKKGQRETLTKKIYATKNYYQQFVAQGLLQREMRLLDQEAFQLQMRLRQLRSTELPRLLSRQTDLSAQLARHEAQATQLAKKAQLARQQLEARRQAFATHDKAYQDASQRYYASHSTLQNRRRLGIAQQQTYDTVGWLRRRVMRLWEYWGKQQDKLKAHPAVLKGIWKLAKAIRTIAASPALYGGKPSPAYLSNPIPLRTIERQMQTVAMSNANTQVQLPDEEVPQTVAALEQWLQQGLQSSGWQQNKKFHEQMTANHAMVQALRRLSATLQHK